MVAARTRAPLRAPSTRTETRSREATSRRCERHHPAERSCDGELFGLALFTRCSFCSQVREYLQRPDVYDDIDEVLYAPEGHTALMRASVLGDAPMVRVLANL